MVYNASSPVDSSENEILLKYLWDNTSDYILCLDEDGVCLEINKAFEGAPREKLIGINFVETYFSDVQQRRWSEIKSNLKTKNTIKDVELVLSGQYFVYWHCQISLLQRPTKHPTYIIIAENITQLKLFQDSLDLGQNYRKNIFETIQDGILITDLSGNILEANQNYCDMLGYSCNELLNTRANNLVHPSFTHDIKVMRKQFLTTGRISVESVQMHKDGKTKIPVEISSSIFTEKGKLILLSIIKDIATKKEAESKLEYSERRYQNLFRHSPDMLLSVDNDSLNVLECNQEFLSKMGYTAEDIIGKSLFNFYAEESIQEAKKVYHRYKMHPNMVYEGERLYLCKDGTYLPVWIKCSGFKYSNRNIICIVARDVTERKNFETELRNSEARYRDLYDNSPDMTVSSSVPEGTITNVNQTLLRVTGYSREELIGQPFVMIYDQESKERAEKVFKNFINGKPVYEFERTLICKDGHQVPINVKATEVFDHRGELIELRGVGRDISERIALENKMKSLQREHQRNLAHVTRVSTMGEMATGLAHELNQPLSAISNFINGCIRRLKSESFDVEKMISAMELAVGEAKRAANIIQWLREFVKNKKHNPQDLDLAEEIQVAINFVHIRSKCLSIDIECHYQDDLPKVFFDKIQLQQILINLLNNAIEAGGMDDDSNLRIKINTQYAENITVYISDNGPGISEDTAAKIFDPFFTTKQDGMGMGLAICRSIMEKNDGNLELHQTSANGTTFALTLPCKFL